MAAETPIIVTEDAASNDGNTPFNVIQAGKSKRYVINDHQDHRIAPTAGIQCIVLLRYLLFFYDLYTF